MSHTKDWVDNIINNRADKRWAPIFRSAPENVELLEGMIEQTVEADDNIVGLVLEIWGETFNAQDNPLGVLELKARYEGDFNRASE